MKVKKKILDLIDNTRTRTELALEVGCGEQTVAFHIRKNRPNGRLTKYDFLMAINKVTGEAVSEILEEETTDADKMPAEATNIGAKV